ncbi:MAG: hypothetical protein H0U29_13005, partial [Acidimicrobiia bacterium]|nr:hypothetical protein [Acidimicrobiia bacterium]
MADLFVVDGEPEPEEVWSAGEPSAEDDWPDVASDPTIPDSFDEAHMAESLAKHLAGDWLYVAASSRWMHWDGTRWARDETEQVYEEARRWAIEFVTVVVRMGASSDD